ncbi:MAG TPA: alkaline phosphatase family protein [Bdellovibrionales bacterium]|nr:alkaline phosphatase family protein [Bdellovibrionales bacterium]
MRFPAWVWLIPILSFFIGFGATFNAPVTRAFDLSSEGVSRTLYETFVTGIYHTVADTKQLAMRVAVPYIARWKIREFLDGLPLDQPVRERINRRLSSNEFVDEVIPFVWSLKDQYTPVDDPTLSFDAWARRHISPLVLGGDHSLFQFKPASASGSAAGGLAFDDKKLIAKVVALYDVLFLQTRVSPLKVPVEPSPELVSKVKPLVRELLGAFSSKLKDNQEVGEAIGGLLKDEQRLDTITVSLIMAVHREAYKAFQIFARKIQRQEALQRWMQENKGDRRLADYLEYAQNQRLYAMHIAVDGLQGNLVESLALNKYHGPFMKALAEDMKVPPKPEGLQVKTLDKQLHHEFLNGFLQTGYRDSFYLPFFRRIYGRKNAVAEFGVSTTPTISVRNLPIVKTGAAVTGEYSTGIPNFHFVDRKANAGKGRAYYFYGNDALLLEDLTQKTGLKTMFERLGGLNGLDCNAQYERGANAVYNAFLNLALGEKVRDFGDALCLRELRRRAENERTLQALRAKLLNLLRPTNFRKVYQAVFKADHRRIDQLIRDIAELEDDGMPQYILYYNPWPDHFAHFMGPFSDEIISPTGELNRLDFWLNEFEKAYEDAGVADRVLWGMAGDHGLAPVYHLLNPEIEVFDYLKTQGFKLVIEKISSDEGEGPKMNHPTRPKSMRDKDVVIASTAGGNYMMDFFLHDNMSWPRQPIHSELLNWKTLQGRRVNIIAVILERLKDSLDYLAVRDEFCDHHRCAVRLMATRAGQRVHARIVRRGSKIFYESPTDLLGVRKPSRYEGVARNPHNYGILLDRCVDAAKLSDQSTWCGENEWRELTSYTEKPDSVAQLSHIYDTDLAGTVNLFPLPGIGYNSKVPGRHAGEHFHEKDAFVGFWGAPVRATMRPRTAVNGSIAPTLYEYLTGKPVEVDKDGWGFPSLLLETK